MSDKAKDFLRRLPTDAELLKSYARDPDQTLDAAGLTADEKRAIKSGDRQEIMKAIGSQASTAGIELVVEVNIKIKL